jgi:erythromycin esterase-like protein
MLSRVVGVAMFGTVAMAAHALAAPPTAEETDWVKQHAIPLKSVEAGNGFEDLQPLKRVIGDARIVSLGEPTHGTREAFQFKHRLVEFLASEMGFTVFGIEASMPEACALNPWVLGRVGEGTDEEAAKLIGGMYFWTWNTEEVLAMVKWMRAFNAREAAAGTGKTIQFTGFDMQTPDVAMQIVADFVEKHDAESLAMVRECYRKAKLFKPGQDDEGEGAGGGGGGGFGVATGTFPSDKAKGKKLVYSGWIRTKDLKDGFAGLWWRCDLAGGKVGAFDNMGGRGPSGTTDWTEYRVELDVPAETVNINFGVIMPGKGEAWFDDLKIELDGKEYRDPAMFAFDFEGEELVGVSPMSTPAYRSEIDQEQAHGGKGSLKVEYVGAKEKVEKSTPAGERTEGKEAVRLAKKVLDHLRDQRDDLVTKAGPKDTDWAIQNARVVWQGYRMYAKGMSSGGFNARDSAMADNTEWIMEHEYALPGSTLKGPRPADAPTPKMILWAHNGHVNRREGAMGGYLAEKFPDQQMVVVGFTTGRGVYTAMASKGGLRSDLPLQAPPEHSVEAVLGSAGIANLMIDLRAADEDDPAAAWAHEQRPMRGIGALEMKQQLYPIAAGKQFDVLVWEAETTAAVQLKSKAGRGKAKE